MSDLIPFNAGQVPAHLAAFFSEDAGNLKPSFQSIDQISIKGGKFRIIESGNETILTRRDQETGDTVPVQIINVVVLDVNKNRSRAYYEGNFVEGENNPPRCASADGVKPDSSVEDPMCGTCAACPMSVKGSKITDKGAQTTACAQTKRLAVVPSGDRIASSKPLLVRLPATSIWDKDNKANEAQGWFAWDQYCDFLRSKGVKHTAAVETRMKFDSRFAYPKVLFSASRYLSAEEAQAAAGRISNDADDLSRITTGVYDGVAGQPAASTTPAPQIAHPEQAYNAPVPGADHTPAQRAAAQAEANNTSQGMPEPAKRGRGRPPKAEATAQAAPQVVPQVVPQAPMEACSQFAPPAAAPEDDEEAVLLAKLAAARSRKAVVSAPTLSTQSMAASGSGWNGDDATDATPAVVVEQTGVAVEASAGSALGALLAAWN